MTGNRNVRLGKRRHPSSKTSPDVEKKNKTVKRETNYKYNKKEEHGSLGGMTMHMSSKQRGGEV